MTSPLFRPAILLGFTAFALFASVGCASGPRPAAEFVQQAQFLHDTALKSAIVRDRDVNDYFALVGKRVIAGATAVDANLTRDPTLATMQFHLVASDVVNAYGTGGGHIYLYNGLLQLCESEEELAALIAIQYAHSLDLDIQQTGMRPDVSQNPDPLAVTRVVFLYANAPFAPPQIADADKRAFDIYTRAGWDPAKFADAFERLRSRGLELPPATGNTGQPRPLLGQRAAAAQQRRSTLPPTAREWRKSNEADPEIFREIKGTAQKLSRQLADPANRVYLYFAAFPNVILPAEQPAQIQAQTQIRRELTPAVPPTPKIEAS